MHSVQASPRSQVGSISAHTLVSVLESIWEDPPRKKACKTHHTEPLRYTKTHQSRALYHMPMAQEPSYEYRLFKKVQLYDHLFYYEPEVYYNLRPYELDPRYHRHCYTVVPRLSTIIRSSKIIVQRNHHQAKVKNPLECINNRLMRSNGRHTSSSSEDPP